MNSIPPELFKKFAAIGQEVKDSFLRKGVVIPVQNDNGTISVGTYTITKDPETGLFSVLDYSGEVKLDLINLPQTAILVANNLALGRFPDYNLIELDKRYGYALFEEELHKRTFKRSLKKSLDKYDISLSKSVLFKQRRKKYRQDIEKSFEKLRRLV